MVKTVKPEELELVLGTWEDLKKQDNYEEVAGIKVMKFLLLKCHKAKPMFGYDIEAEVDTDEFLADPKFTAHSTKLIGMFDQALHMIGPEGALLTEKIKELGEKHVHYGVRAEMFPIMGKGLMAMLEEQLADGYTEDVRAAWAAVFRVISEDLMITVLKASKEGRAPDPVKAEKGAVAA